MAKLTGGCLCGSVRYECDATPLGTAVCHCTHCQKVSGSAFSVNVLVPAAGVVALLTTVACVAIIAAHLPSGISVSRVLRMAAELDIARLVQVWRGTSPADEAFLLLSLASLLMRLLDNATSVPAP